METRTDGITRLTTPEEKTTLIAECPDETPSLTRSLQLAHPREAWDKANTALELAVRAVQELRRACGELPGLDGTRRRIEAYLLPHLEDWSESHDQIGSLPSIKAELDQFEQDGEVR